MPGDEPQNQAVVVQPDPGRERRVVDERGITAPKEGVDHLPGTAKHEDETRIGEHVGPELEKQDGSGILPPPDAPLPSPDLDQGRGLGPHRFRYHGNRVGREALRRQAVAHQRPLVKLVEVKILEVTDVVAVAGAKEPGTHRDTRPVEERCEQRRPRTVHAADHKHAVAPRITRFGRWTCRHGNDHTEFAPVSRSGRAMLGAGF